jgi:hypothetical protein
MAASKSRKAATPAIDVELVSAQLCDWLERGDEAPDVLATLTPRQYADVLAGIQMRFEIIAKTRAVAPKTSALTILLANRDLPATKAGTEARAATVRLAAAVDPFGDTPAYYLGQALARMELSPVAAELFVHKSGPLLKWLDSVAKSWTTKSDDGPTADQSAAFARLLAAQLKASGGHGPILEQSEVLESLAKSMRSIQVKDHQVWSLDPLLLSMATAVSAAAGTRQLREPEPATKSLETPAAKREHLLSSLRSICRAVESELEGISKYEDQLHTTRLDAESLRRQRDILEQTISNLRNEAVRLTDALAGARTLLSCAKNELVAAKLDSERWRGESKQGRLEAATEIREKIARAGREILQITERYGLPLMAALEQQQISTDDIEPLRVNLKNLVQKLNVQASRMITPTESSQQRNISAEAPQNDETRN